jgi:hypothetical protein
MKQSAQTERIQQVLGEFEDLSVKMETVEVFYNHLTEKINMPCDVVSIGEYEKYQLYGIENSNDELFGLLGKVKLLTDEKKESVIPLCDLKAVDNRSESFDLLSDYATWFVNNQ